MVIAILDVFFLSYTKIVIKMFILFVIHMILDFYQISLNFFNKCCKNCFDLIKTIELSF